jgi:hypothetical protein
LRDLPDMPDLHRQAAAREPALEHSHV